jgi:hypothetical protein
LTVTETLSVKSDPPESPFRRKFTVQWSVTPPGLLGDTVRVSS